MKTYPTLYSRDSKDKVRVWFQQRDGDKFRTVAGIKDGNLVTAEWTTALPKNLGKSNETTGEMQAEAEIEAKYKKQIASGYFENIKDIDEELYFSPQLAKGYEDYKDTISWETGHYVSPKLDGLRCVATSKGLFSRNGKTFVSFPHISRELKKLFVWMPNLILDGEIYCDKLSNDFNKIISLAKRSKPTPEDFVESEKYLQYHIFDCPSIEGGFHNRFSYLKKQILIDNGYKDSKWIRLCPHTLITNPADIEVYLNKYIQDGFEGLMLNLYSGKYENKRSKSLLKYKLFKDCEAEIMDIIEGVGNRSGGFGYANMKLDNGITFDSSARGNEELYKEILKNKKNYIGKRATVRYQNLSPDGVPRFPVIIDFDRFDT